MGVLSDDKAYRDMMCWHERYVRRETDIDVTLLVSVINDRLADFDRFRDEILTYCRVPATQ